MAGSAAAPAARCRNRRRGSFIATSHFTRLYSITSSARASSVGGISRPSALAVVRLISSSNCAAESKSVALFPRVVGRVDIVDLPRPNAVDLKYGLLIEDAEMCGLWLHNCYAARRE